MDPSLPLILALLVGFAEAAQVSYCSGTCPEFTIISSNSDYEVREYGSTNWTCTNLTSITISGAQSATAKLQSFRSQHIQNDTKKAWPAVVKVTETGNDNYYEACWFVPPNVTLSESDGSDNVTVETFPKTMFVREFGGIPSIANVKQNMQDLKDALYNDGKSYNTTVYFGAGYEHFFVIKHHNEIWIAEV